MDMTTTAEAPATRQSALPPGIKPIGMTVAGACEYFPVSRAKLFQWLSAGRLDKFYVGDNIRVTIASAERLKDELLKEARSKARKRSLTGAIAARLKRAK